MTENRKIAGLTPIWDSSAQGRFTSADSFGGSASDPQSLNRYAYAGNNPVNFSDPSGHDRFSASSNGFARTMGGGQGSYMDPDNDDPTGQAHHAQVVIDSWIALEAAEQQAKSGSTAYAGDGTVDAAAGETAADEGKQAPQNPIEMSVTVAQEPHIEQNLKLGDQTLTGVGAQLEIRLTDKSGNPFSGSITESNQEGGAQNPNAAPLTQGYFKDWVGSFGDASRMPGTVEDLKEYVTTTPITVTSHQTLTMSFGQIVLPGNLDAHVVQR